jgi:hypothetical protein
MKKLTKLVAAAVGSYNMMLYLAHLSIIAL